MSFVKKKVDTTPIEDTVFAIVKMGKEAAAKLGEDKVIQATIGSLYNEEGSLVAFDSVFEPYDHIVKEKKAAYAGSFVGNDDYRQQVYDWVVKPSGCTLAHSVIATPGGTGAVALTINEMLDENETVVLPEIAWGSYQLMASMANLNVKTYQLFENDHFNMASLKAVCLDVISKQDKLLLVMNDPCHNPTGYSLSIEEWEEVVAFLNECSKQVSVVLLNDIAYIDYAYDLDQSRNYMKTFDQFSENVFAVIAFSCSKSLTSYGLRCGAAVLLGKTQEAIRSVEVVFEKAARATWSNIPNAAMDNFTYVTTENSDAYLKEKEYYVQLLKQRSSLFINEADACKLPYYPYKEGFFVTLEMSNNAIRNRCHEALLANHIYTVKVNKGIRIAICSLGLVNIKGLASRIKNIFDKVQS